jgi:drug/metabolite transporter (DMT)-like permease
MAETVYLLCALASLACAGLLLRSYRNSRMPLILWTSLCFVGFAVNNILLFVDLAVLPEAVDLRMWRNLIGLLGVSVLLYGMIRSELP